MRFHTFFVSTTSLFIIGQLLMQSYIRGCFWGRTESSVSFGSGTENF